MAGTGTSALEIRAVPIEQLRTATDNPRFIRRDRLDNLKESIERDPDFMWRRPVLARTDGTIYAGNQRYRACTELGWKTIPAIVSDITESLAQQRGLRDNNTWGDWDDEALIQFIQDIARTDADGTATLGFNDVAIRTMLAESDVARPTPQSELPPVQHRERTRYEEDGEEGEEQTPLHSAPAQDGSAWQEGTIKQVVLQWPADVFNGVQEKLDALRDALKVDNNTDAVTKLLEGFYDAHAEEE